MWLRSRKTKREEEALEVEALEVEAPPTSRIEERTGSRLRSLDGYDFDEEEAKEVEARIRRMTYGHKVEK